MYAYLREPECRLLNENEAYVKNFVFNRYIEYFTYIIYFYIIVLHGNK